MFKFIQEIVLTLKIAVTDFLCTYVAFLNISHVFLFQ